jgi:hypothetical protein
MVNFDHEYNIHDVYYPHVGQDNQTAGDVSFSPSGVQVRVDRQPDMGETARLRSDSLVTRVEAHSDSLQLDMVINDTGDFDRDVLVRRVERKNLSDKNARPALHALRPSPRRECAAPADVQSSPSIAAEAILAEGAERRSAIEGRASTVEGLGARSARCDLKRPNYRTFRIVSRSSFIPFS